MRKKAHHEKGMPVTMQNQHHAKRLVGITDKVVPPADIEMEAFPEAEFVFLRDWRESATAAETWRRVDALLVWHWKLRADSIAMLDRCRIAVRYGVGYDNVDVSALAGRTIPFANTPDYGTEEVADTACAMILAAQRKIIGYDRACRNFRTSWQNNVLNPLRRTSEQTLGIIGVGRIGTAVVNRMKPFGYRIVGYDPYQSSGHEKAVGYIRMNSLDELLAESDIVSCHCPLTDETKGMMDERFMDRLKPGAAVVNTARGGLLASLDCLESALKNGRLAAAFLDVLPEEPPGDHSLYQAWRSDEDWLRGRLIVNPHTAFYSERAWYEMRYKAAETIRRFFLSGQVRNQIVP